MLNGKKITSEKILLKSLKKIQKSNKKKNFKDIIRIGLINNSPIVYIKSIKRKRKQTIEFPFLLKNSLRISYGIKFIIKNSKQKSSMPFYFNLHNNLNNSSKFIGLGVEKANNLHKSAVLKKKFSNYRWF